jgi:hypothetical protein
MNDPISTAVQEVVDLFTSELAELRFGELEGSVLARAADEVKAVAAEVVAAEMALDSVRARLADKQEVLTQKAQRALAYARVFAEGQPELASRIEQIAIPRTPRRPAKIETNEIDEGAQTASEAPGGRRRGRPRRAETGATLLGLETEASPGLPTAGALPEPIAVG